MASRLFNQFLDTLNPKLVLLEGSFTIGASGAVAPSSACVGRGLASSSAIQNLGTGMYLMRFGDNYSRLIGFHTTVFSPVSGTSAVTSDGSLVVGKAYQVRFASTSTNWQTLGVPSGVTAQIGVPFIATSGASGGNGTVVPITTSGIANMEVLPNPNLTLGPLPTQGAYIAFQTLNYSGTPTNPTSGSVIRFNALFRDSSLLGTNETPSNY